MNNQGIIIAAFTVAVSIIVTKLIPDNASQPRNVRFELVDQVRSQVHLFDATTGRFYVCHATGCGVLNRSPLDGATQIGNQ